MSNQRGMTLIELERSIAVLGTVAEVIVGCLNWFLGVFNVTWPVLVSAGNAFDATVGQTAFQKDAT